MQTQVDYPTLRELTNTPAGEYESAALTVLSSMLFDAMYELDIHERCGYSPLFWQGVAKMLRKGLAQKPNPAWVNALADHCEQLGGLSTSPTTGGNVAVNLLALTKAAELADDAT